MVLLNQESSETFAAAATNKHACHSLKIGNLVIVVWIFCFVWKTITGIAFSRMADVLDTFVWDKELQFISVIARAMKMVTSAQFMHLHSNTN